MSNDQEPTDRDEADVMAIVSFRPTATSTAPALLNAGDPSRFGAGAARIKVIDGATTSFLIAERVQGGWQSGVMNYPDAIVVRIDPVYVIKPDDETVERAARKLDPHTWDDSVFWAVSHPNDKIITGDQLRAKARARSLDRVRAVLAAVEEKTNQKGLFYPVASFMKANQPEERHSSTTDKGLIS